MRKNITFILIFVLAFLNFNCVAYASTFSLKNGEEINTIVKVASYNLLFEKALPEQEDKRWSNRINQVKYYFDTYNFDIVGIQEACTYQIDMLSGLLEEYGHFGLSLFGKNERLDENSTIFYRKDRFLLNGHGDFWYSDTPDVIGSYSWADYPRKCTWGRFVDKKSNKEFYVFNSHFYFEQEETRCKCASLLYRKIKEIAGESPIYCIGDLNSNISQPALVVLTASGYLKDSKSIAETASGPEGTYHGFDKSSSLVSRIDHILVSDKINIIRHIVIDGEMDKCNWGSDHLPVLVVSSVK